MSKIRAYSTVNFSGFLFGDLKKNIPQIVGGLVSTLLTGLLKNWFEKSKVTE